LPTSSKPCSCFSSSPLKQSSEAAAAVSKDASSFPDLKGRKSGCNLLVVEEEEEEDNSSTVPVAAAKEETDLQSSNSRLRLQQGAASKQQEEEEEEEEQLTICLSTRIPQHRTKLACISLSNPHKLPETTVLIDMLEEEEEEEGCCCCLGSSLAHPAALNCLSAQKLKKP
jgi:hypothetical protein